MRERLEREIDSARRRKRGSAVDRSSRKEKEKLVESSARSTYSTPATGDHIFEASACVYMCVCVYIYECPCAFARVSFLAYTVLQREVARIVRFAIIRVGNTRASYSLHLFLSRLSFSLFAYMYLCMYVCITCLVSMRLRDTLDVLLGS